MFSNDKKLQNVADAVSKIMNEKLHPNQQKLDVHEPEKDKLTADDFKKLRAGKKVQEATAKPDFLDLDKDGNKKEPMKKASGQMKKEEAEQIDELSKDTLKSYMGKAKTELGIHARNVGNPGASAKDQEVANASAAKRTAGATRAGQKLKEAEQINEYQSKGGVYKHKGTYGTEKSTEAGYTDYDKENELAKKNLTDKPAKKKYGARQNFVRSTRVNESFSGLIDVYNQNGIKGLFESLNKEEVEQLDELSPGTLKSYVKGAKAEVRDAEDVRDSARAAGDGKTANEMYQFTKKRNAGIKQAKAKLNAEEVEYVEVEVTDLDDVNGVTVETIEERTLTEPETKKKEEVVKSMKKGLSGFKARYGDDAKSVMYATATKIAKKD